METRRTLLSGLGAMAATVVASPLIANPREREKCFGTSGVALSANDVRLSHAVTEGALNALCAILAHGADDARRRVAAHAWNVTGDHFSETGFFATSDQLARESRMADVLQAITDLPARMAEVAAAHGAAIDAAALQTRIAAIPVERLTAVQNGGTRHAFESVTEWLDLGSTASRLSGPRISTNDTDECQALGMIEATLWILAGLYAFGCAATLGICVACCVAAAVLSIAAGVIDFISVVEGC